MSSEPSGVHGAGARCMPIGCVAIVAGSRGTSAFAIESFVAFASVA